MPWSTICACPDGLIFQQGCVTLKMSLLSISRSEPYWIRQGHDYSQKCQVRMKFILILLVGNFSLKNLSSTHLYFILNLSTFVILRVLCAEFLYLSEIRMLKEGQSGACL